MHSCCACTLKIFCSFKCSENCSSSAKDKYVQNIFQSLHLIFFKPVSLLAEHTWIDIFIIKIKIPQRKINNFQRWHKIFFKLGFHWRLKKSVSITLFLDENSKTPGSLVHSSCIVKNCPCCSWENKKGQQRWDRQSWSLFKSKAAIFLPLFAGYIYPLSVELSNVLRSI